MTSFFCAIDSHKQLDFLLVDSNGYIDVIEIKKPFENAIMTKGIYRDNYSSSRAFWHSNANLKIYLLLKSLVPGR